MGYRARVLMYLFSLFLFIPTALPGLIHSAVPAEGAGLLNHTTGTLRLDLDLQTPQ